MLKKVVTKPTRDFPKKVDFSSCKHLKEIPRRVDFSNCMYLKKIPNL